MATASKTDSGGGPVIISASRRTDIPAFYTPWLLNRIEDKQVRTLVKKSLKRNDNAATAVKRLNNARWRTAKAQEVMKTAFGLNGSGASLNTSWEKRFWKSFASDLKNGNSETSLTDQDLARLRDSLVAQTTKTILYAKGLEALAKAADEQLVMLQQIQTRMQTGFTLGRQEEQAVRRAEEELLTASRQREQLTQARAHAIAALEFLIGSNPLPGASTSSARVKAPARGLSSTLVDNRPDVQHAIDELAVSLNQNGNDELVLLPDFPVTGKGGRPTKALDKQLSGKKRKSLQAGDGLLAPGYVVSSDRQQAALAKLGKQLVIALAESRDQLRRGRQHQGHVRALPDQQRSHDVVEAAHQDRPGDHADAPADLIVKEQPDCRQCEDRRSTDLRDRRDEHHSGQQGGCRDAGDGQPESANGGLDQSRDDDSVGHAADRVSRQHHCRVPA